MAQLKNELDGRCEQIRHEIDRTRLGIDRKLDAIEERLTPREMAFDAWAMVRKGSIAGASRLWQAAQDHPLPATMIAGGIGWLVYESQTSSEPGKPAAGIGQKVSEAAALRERVSHAGAEAAHWAGDAKERVSGVTADAKRQASRIADDIRQRSRKATKGLRRRFDERPLAVGLAALAVGLVAGLAVPASRREDEWFGETRDRLLETARRAGREAIDKARRATQVAIDTTKDAAERAEIDPQHLADKARQVGREVKQAVKEELGPVIR